MNTTIAEGYHLDVEGLSINIFDDRSSQGGAAADYVIRTINAAIAEKGQARVIFACAPSQDDFLRALVARRSDINWSKVVAFHMDDYVGISAAQTQSFRYYLKEHLLQWVPCGSFNPIQSDSEDVLSVSAEYEQKLKEAPLDLVCMGIGENGHIAFNDPHVADFEDSSWVKVVELDEACRRQQVNDGCFHDFESVPSHAFTLTIPALMSCRHVSCVVPGILKAEAVRRALYEGITTDCPASILRQHKSAVLWLDNQAASKLVP